MKDYEVHSLYCNMPRRIIWFWDKDTDKRRANQTYKSKEEWLDYAGIVFNGGLWFIHSVRRTSDNLILEIGDKVKINAIEGTIEKFIYKKGDIEVTLNNLTIEL